MCNNTIIAQSFSAASESPCGHGLLHDTLTFTSLSPEAQKILDTGLCPLERLSLHPLLDEFLASFIIPDSIKNEKDTGRISTVISESDVRYGFSKWKETTSTSPSGRHLGHYKAAIQDPILLTASMTTFLNIAINRGVTIKRWCSATNMCS
jgi:hypothetical protein